MSALKNTCPKPPNNIDFNELSIDELFDKYEKIGFIYPSKKVLLSPYWETITKNWEQLLANKNQLLWILNTNSEREEKFASVSVIKQGNHSLMAQHLVSEGNPFLSLKVMLAAQFRAEYLNDATQVQSSQNWFRPNNRYAFRIFASMLDRLGTSKANLREFQYFHMDLKAIQQKHTSKYYTEEITGINTSFLQFVREQYGEVFIKGEELDQADIQLKKLNKAFLENGLSRRRKIIQIKNTKTDKVQACVIANRAPLGLNFSFLENRTYYIIDKDLPTEQHPELLAYMNSQIKSFYADFPLQKIPIVTDKTEAKAFENIEGSEFIRSYMQSIWLRAGFSEWYKHIQSFLDRIQNRKLKPAKAA